MRNSDESTSATAVTIKVTADRQSFIPLPLPRSSPAVATIPADDRNVSENTDRNNTPNTANQTADTTIFFASTANIVSVSVSLIRIPTSPHTAAFMTSSFPAAVGAAHTHDVLFLFRTSVPSHYSRTPAATCLWSKLHLL